MIDIQNIETELNQMVCATHNQQAKVFIETFGSGHNIQIQNSCCTEFSTILTEKGSGLIADGIAGDIMDALKW